MPRNGVAAYLDDGYLPVENPDDEQRFDERGNLIPPAPQDIQGVPGIIGGRGLINQQAPPDQQVPDAAPPVEAPTGTQSYGDDEHEIGLTASPAAPTGPTAPGNQFGDLAQRSISKILGDGTKQNPGPPVMQTPKWWQRAIAGGVGAAAGWSNAASRARTPIDIKAATEGILHPGYAEKMAQYQSQIAPLEKATEIAGQVGAYGQKMAMDQSEIDLRKAQADYARGMGRTEMIVTPELERLSKGVYRAGTRIPTTQVGAVLKAEQDRIAAKETTFKVTDPDLAAWIGVKPGDAVPISTYNAGLNSYRKPDPKEPIPKNLTPEDILLHPGDFKPDIVKKAQVMWGEQHRPPQNTFNISTALTPDAVDQAARLYLATGHLDSYSSGPAGAQMRSTVMNRAAEISKAESNGGPPVDLAANRIDFQATQASVKDLTRTLARVASSEGTTSKNLDLAASVSGRVDRFGSPFFNKYLLWTKGKLAGDDDTQLLSNAVETAANEYANVVTAGTGGGTAATDASRQHARDMLSAAMANGTFQKVVAQMKVEMGNRKKSINEQLQALRNPQRQQNQNGAQPLFDGNVKAPPGNSQPAGNIMDRWGYKPGKK